MLTIGQFKKVCNYADGFTLEAMGIQSPCLDYYGFMQAVGCKTIQVNRFKKEVYPLFLQAVIDGMNKKLDDYVININECVEIFDFYGDPVEDFICTNISLELREQAIIYVLNKISE